MEKHHNEQEHAYRVLAEQNRHLYGSLPGTLVITALLAVVLCVTHWGLVAEPILLGWLIAFAVIAGSRMLLFRAYQNEFGLPEASLKWYVRYRTLTLLSGILWGSSAWVFFDSGTSGHQALLTFLVAGLGAGGVVNVASRWQCAWLFLLPALLPFALRFWLLETPLSNTTALLIVIYVAALLVMSRQLANRTEEHIRGRIAQADKAKELQRQQQHYQSLVESTTAIIWEGDPDTLEFRYVSPESKKLLGYSPEQWTSEPDFWPRHIHPDDREWAVEFCRRAVRDRRRHSFDYRMIDAEGRTVWLRDVVNIVVIDGKPQKLVGVMIDISELKTIQRDLEYVSGLQRLMVEVSRMLFEADEADIDDALYSTLEKVGSCCRADRAYLIWFTPDLAFYSNTHEWVAAGISSERDDLQDVPSTTIPRLLEKLKRKQRAVLPDIQALGEEWAAEKTLFAVGNIQSLMALPIFADDELVGLIGFDSVLARRDWSGEEAALLQALGDLIGMAVDRRDKTRRLRASEALRTHAEALAGMGSWEWVVGTEEFTASTEWRRVAGCGYGPLTREQVLQLTPEAERRDVVDALNSTVKHGHSYNVEHRIVRPDNGEARWVAVHAELVDLGDGRKSLRGFAQDITERKETEKKLFDLAHYDSLTGMPNRVLVLDRLQQALKRARRNGTQVAVLFLDLDHFKKVNDTLGHDAGDRTLVDAASRLQSLFRAQDTVSRIGGDEFVIVLDDFEHVSDIIGSTSKIVDAFKQALVVDDREFILTTSIGIALSPHDGTTAHDLLRNADTAMYHAKSKGRDGYQFFTRSMNEAVERQLALEEALRGAVARRELYLKYQPVIRLEDRTCVGAEALLRWRHPALGEVLPDEFIRVAEQSGLIEELGDFVIDEVIAQVVDWRNRVASDFCVSINVSPRQFREPRLAERIIAAMQSAGLSNGALEIEVTEGLLLPGRREVEHALRTLRRGGIGIVMDDFGTGYASLSYLRDHPFTSLKIDRSFIGRLDSDQRQRQLVVSALRLGQALGMKVVAEGVETEAQLEVLIEEGCAFVQGYLFSRPVIPEEIEAMMSA
ncbi:MAG: EAL domain-containing protein [Wenzhouxiangellaceae bacterium]|nr:EAL domain-containing protein [Wenzhouxiangellaceae bacterium]